MCPSCGEVHEPRIPHCTVCGKSHLDTVDMEKVAEAVGRHEYHPLALMMATIIRRYGTTIGGLKSMVVSVDEIYHLLNDNMGFHAGMMVNQKTREVFMVIGVGEEAPDMEELKQVLEKEVSRVH